MRVLLHLALHVLTPAAVAGVAYRERFWKAWGILLATMLVDLDHLLASPIFDPCRCSIGFHPLHTAPAIACYLLLLLSRKTRLVGLGLCLHMLLDLLDCWMM